MKKNLIFAGVIFALACVLSVPLLLRENGAQAVVSIVGGESFTLSLENDGVYTFDTDTGASFTFTLQVEDGAIFFIDSQCPDHVCEGFGHLRQEGEQAICVPAGVVVYIS